MVTSAVLHGLLHDPDPNGLNEFLEEHLRGPDSVVQIAGECEIIYHGRAASVAEAGDYIVLIKPDGTLLVHGHRGVKPVNWQPRCDELRPVIEDGRCVLYAERYSPSELVRIDFLSPIFAAAVSLREATGFELIGTEAQMQEALARTPELIEEGLSLLDRELPTEVGGIDLYARDRSGRLVVVELKRGKAGQEAVHQLQRYVDRVRTLNGGDKPVRGILAAPDITTPALQQLQRQGLEFREVKSLPTEEEQEQPGLFG